MKLLNTYEDREEAESAEKLISGPRRLASERDSTETIYNLFGEPNWGNFYRLEMYMLKELKELLNRRAGWSTEDVHQHEAIIRNLEMVSKKYNIEIPSHWK